MPSTGYLLWIGFLPLITIVFIAGIIGPRILALPASKTHLAGIYGSLLAIAAFAIWAILLETFPGSDILNNAARKSSDIPGAAIVVAYLVVLPSMVFVIVAIGAIAGILLHILFSNRSDHRFN
jgi:hypothetical protein